MRKTFTRDFAPIGYHPPNPPNPFCDAVISLMSEVRGTHFRRIAYVDARGALISCPLNKTPRKHAELMVLFLSKIRPFILYNSKWEPNPLRYVSSHLLDAKMLVKANPLLLCQLTLLVAALASFLYDRSRVLYTFYANTPDRLPSVNTFQSHEVKFPNIRNCEDVLLLEDKGLALLACDDGREMWNVVQVRTRLFFKKKKKKKKGEISG